MENIECALMLSYTKTGIISSIITIIGMLGIILQSFVPNFVFIFSALFYLGILGITISFYAYSLHLYEFNSLILSNLTFSSVIVLYLLSYNFVSYSTIVQLSRSGIQGWLLLALYLALIVAGSWALLFIGHSIRIVILSAGNKPTVKKETPGVYGAFAMILLVITFVSCNTIIASGTLSSPILASVNNNPGPPDGNDQQYAPIVNLIESFFNEQFNPQLAQEHDRALQHQWDTGISLFVSGDSKCTENSSAVAGIPSLKPGLDITALCDGIRGGDSDLRKSDAYLSGISDGSSFAVSKQSSLGLLVPVIENISWSCESSETACRQAELAAQNQDDVRFQFNIQAIHSDVVQMRTDYNDATAFVATT